MPKKFGREIALLMLPVLGLGAAAWWRGTASPPEFKNPFAPQKIDGPPRLLLTPWKRVAVTPRDVSDGYGFATETNIETVYRTNLPAGVRHLGDNMPAVEKSQLRYRRRGKWFLVPYNPAHPTVMNHIFSGFNKEKPWEESLRLKVRLEAVPRDAQEIRLSGRVQNRARYSGTWPQALKRPGDIRPRRYGDMEETLLSPPFDIEVKTPQEPFPTPRVSTQEALEILEVRFSRYRRPFELQMWIKRKPWAIVKNPQTNPQVWDGKLLDGNGREIDVYSTRGTKQGNAATRGWTRYSPDSKKSYGVKENEELLYSSFGGEAPLTGWKKIKLPLRLEVKISENGSWPTIYKGPLREVKDFKPPLSQP